MRRVLHIPSHSWLICKIRCLPENKLHDLRTDISTLSMPIGFPFNKVRSTRCSTFLVTIAIVVTVFLYAEMQMFPAFPSIYAELFSSRMRKAFTYWQRCMIGRLENRENYYRKFWKEFGEVIGYCVSDTEVHRIKLTPLKNTDEVKYYLFSKNASEPSVVVTLGVGEDIEFEKQLQKSLPYGSEFFGADPISVRNAELFSSVGTFIPVAVSNTSAQAESIVYVNRTYKKMRVKHVGFKAFIMEIINRARIDHLAIDTEGAEDDIFPMIAVDGTLLRYNITICHMNVEFHFQNSTRRFDNFAKLMLAAIRKGRFAAIHREPARHQRIFFVNYENPFCIEKYLEQFF